MTFMDILRKETPSNTIFDTLIVYFNNSEVIEAKTLVRDISNILKLSKKNMDNVEKERFNNKIDFPFYNKIINVDKKFTEALEGLNKFYDNYKQFINAQNKQHEKFINNEEYKPESVLPQEWVYIREELTPKAIEKTLVRLNSFMNLTSKKRNIYLSNKGSRSEQSVPFILEEMLKKSLNREEYNEDFSILKSRGLFGKIQLRKISIIISAIEKNKLIPPSRINLKDSDVIFKILKSDYKSKSNIVNQGYEIFKDILRAENILLPTSDSSNILEDFMSSYKSSSEIEEELKKLNDILRTPDYKDDVIYFKDLSTFQNIIFMAERMYDDMQDNSKLRDRDFDKLYSSKDEFKEYMDEQQIKYGEKKEEDLISNETKEVTMNYSSFMEDVVSEAEDFKRLYGTLAWLVFKLEDEKLLREREIRIDNRLLDRLDLTKVELNSLYDEKFAKMKLSEITRGIKSQSENKKSRIEEGRKIRDKDRKSKTNATKPMSDEQIWQRRLKELNDNASDPTTTTEDE